MSLSEVAWQRRLKVGTILFVSYIAVAEVKHCIDGVLIERAKKRREELRQKMTIAERDDWTVEELSEYDGHDPDKPILIAIEGQVFNVWRRRDLYGADGGYQDLVGKDATRLLAKQSLQDDEDDGAPLNNEELERLQNWKEYYRTTYDYCGRLSCG
mmetsp:Transcript_49697/g.105820  ORF Transcript_49697/g.105820 Transcript_49697/m.105820 type:complete len:156 (+) Transcript_49697:159-626(+)